MDKTLTDAHVHLFAFPSAQDDNILSPKLARSLLFSFLRSRLGIPSDEADQGRAYVEKLTQEIQESRYVKNAIALGLDGVYTSTGELDRERTSFMITNDYVFKVSREHPELIPGASVNPMRTDALDELERVKELGSPLVKILPNTQGFDPSDERFIPFYKKMEELNLPLLAHSGFEFALPSFDQSLGDPALLRGALDLGVTVIVAHGGSTGIGVYEKYFNTVLKLARDYENVLFDASALTCPSRALMLLKIRSRKEIIDKLIFATDYPMQPFTFPFIFSIPPKELFRISRVKNLFDKNYMIFKALGLKTFNNPPAASVLERG